MVDTQVVKYIVEFEAKYADQMKRQLDDLKGRLKTVDGSMKQVKDTSDKTSKSQKTLAENIAFLGKRALIVIPIWTALRNVFTLFFNTIGSGIAYIEELDSVLARSKAVVQGVTSVFGFMQKLESQIVDLSLQTGRSVKEIGEIFYRFAETGLDAETALSGMNTALKLSVATFSDTTEVARIMVDLYNILGDTIPGVTTAQEKLDSIAGTFAVLWKENAGNLGEYIEALKNFQGIAKSFKLNMQDTLALTVVLHNFAQRGGMAGTQLARAFQEMAKNIDKVELVLGKKLRGQNFDWLEILTELIAKVNREMSTGTVPQTLLNIFGERSQKGVAGLASSMQVFLDKMRSVKDLPLEEKMKVLNNLFEIQTNTIKLQSDRMHQLLNVTVESFVKATTGSLDYVEALTKINNAIDSLRPVLVAIGTELNLVFFELPKLSLQGWKDLFTLIRSELNIEPKKEGFWDWLYKDMTKNSDALDKFLDKYSQIANQRKKVDKDFRSDVKKEKTSPTSPDVSSTEDFENLFKIARSSTEYQLAQLELLKAYGANDVALQRAKLNYLMEHSKELKNQEEISKQYLVLQKAINDQLIENSLVLQNSVKNAFTDVLKEGGNFTAFFDNIGQAISDKMAESISSSLSSNLFELTGLGSVFGTLTSEIENAHLTGILKGAEIITNAHMAGMQAAMSYYSPPGMVSTPSSSDNSAKNQLAKLLALRNPGIVGGVSALGLGALGGAAGGRGIGGALLGGTQMLATAINPLLGLLIGLGGGLFGGLFRKSKSETTVQEEERTFQVASRIDVTNKELKIVNRNLLALKQTFETYILPSTAYFSEKRNLADEFALHSQRGLI